MIFPNYRTTNLVVALGCAALMAIAVFYFQDYLGLVPCYLCITQRVFVIAAGVICAVAALHNPLRKGQQAYAGLLVICAATGDLCSYWGVANDSATTIYNHPCAAAGDLCSCLWIFVQLLLICIDLLGCCAALHHLARVPKQISTIYTT